MNTYAYRHIELDKVGYSKKRVSTSPSSEILKVLCSTPNSSKCGNAKARRSLSQNDSFSRLFGVNEDAKNKPTPRRGCLVKQDVKNRNPVTGNGVDSWDSKARTTPKIHSERNPLTGEAYTIVTPATSPTTTPNNGFAQINGSSTLSTPVHNGKFDNAVILQK